MEVLVFNLTTVVSNVQNNRVAIITTHFPTINQQNDTIVYQYGGLPFPDLTNYTDFEQTIQNSISSNNFTSEYDGLLVFDMENWTPVWDTLSQVYKDAIVNYTIKKYPNLTKSNVNKRARQLWTENSMNLMLKAVSIARNECPNSNIGYYGYPGMPYWGNQTDFSLSSQHNDQLFSLWNSVDVLLPSIYLPYISTGHLNTYYNNLHYVRRKIDESVRIRNILNRTDMPIYPYTWHRYHDPLDKNFLRYYDTRLEYGYSYYREEVDGVVLWSSENNQQRMEDTKSWFQNNSGYLESL